MPETHEKPAVDWLGEGREPPVLPDGTDPLPRYAELHCISNFSFQRGASHPQELVRRAWDLGYEALAITDECSVAGVVRAWKALKEYSARARELETRSPSQKRWRDFRLLYGSEFDFGDGRLLAIARDLDGWGGLCEFISAARMHSDKGTYDVSWETSDLTLLQGCEILFAPRREPMRGVTLSTLASRLAMLKTLYAGHLALAAELPHLRDDELWLAALRDAAENSGVPLVATGDVHMHARARKPLQDVISAVRLGKPVRDCGQALQGNAERHLRRRVRLAELYAPELLSASLEVAARCRFDLSSIQYEFPPETVPQGLTPTEALRKFTLEGATKRFPQGVPYKIRRLIAKELALIEDCKYEMFFLTVRDIVMFAESRSILCQGRGSAANSVVCYCLGITAADPRVSNPLLERFISKNRKTEPPDIDVDFEHERREEVIQYIYEKYGRERAAIAAVVIGYRTRSAIRDVGMALAVPEPLIDAFAKEHFWFDDALAVERLGDLGLKTGIELAPHTAALWLELTQKLKGFPRHLSQHVGGFVLTKTRLVRLVPVENAAMKDRSIIQWDKDDLEDMGMLKVDVLALGMLTALRRCLDFREQVRGQKLSLRDIPQEDPHTYQMIRRADTVGVFQIESRAQMSMLPRLKPTTFYDLVVEVAIVRPGPITGGMVHPYLKARERRARGESIEYERSSKELPHEEPRLKKALERTLGIPIFQEQVMEISMIAAGFTAERADALRRGMAAWKRTGGVDRFEEEIIGGMLVKGYNRDFAERIFKQIEGFGEYGFPESHAYSFALLAYASSWLKCHEPDCFLAAMLNSQPMGFYSPSQLIQDARRHGIEVLPPDVSASDWDCTLEAEAISEAHPAHPARPMAPAPISRPLIPVRLGLRLVGSLGEKAGLRIMEARQAAPFINAEDLALRAALEPREMQALASGDALQSLSGHRRQQVWDAAAQKRPAKLLQNAPLNEEALDLEEAPEGEEIVFDYASLGFTLRRHPLALLRPRLARMKLLNAGELARRPDGSRVSACGIVTLRQQPASARGTIFLTLEDETGSVNVIVWKSVREGQREALLQAKLLAVDGIWQRDTANGGRVCHLIAETMTDLTPLLGRLAGQGNQSRDFH